MWPFTRRPKPEPDRDTDERLDDVEDSVKHLERRFIRLQQQFTRWAREFEDDDEPDEEDEDEVIAAINQARRNRG